MKDEENKKLKNIIDAIDLTMDQFEINKNIVFKNLSDLKSFHFNYIKNSIKSWRTSNTCMYPGCNNKSISFSDTIQKSGPLKNISENNHVLHPQFSHKFGTMEMVKLGLNYASTFPGFCKKHENIFQEFETDKEFVSFKHYQQQIFRTICRDVVIKKHEVERFKKLKLDYQSRQNLTFKEVFDNNIENNEILNNDIRIRSIKFEYNDFRLTILNEAIEKAESHLYQMEKLYKASSHDILIGKEQELSSVIINADIFIPVCLAGIGVITVPEDNKNISISLILNVLPFYSNTVVMASTLKKHEKYLSKYMDYFSQNAILLLNMVESWMIYGSDHWFIKPSIWYALPGKRREKILNNIFDISRNIVNQYNVSIFDELRKSILKILVNMNKGSNYSSKISELIEKEYNKFKLSGIEKDISLKETLGKYFNNL